MAFLNSIVDKHLIPGVISIIAMVSVYSITPSDNTTLVSVGSTLFLLLIFCIAFVIVELMIFLFGRFKTMRSEASNKRENEVYVGRSARENLERLWTYVDTLSPSERKLLGEFVESDNKPYVENGDVYHAHDTLLNSNVIHKRRMHKNSNESTEYVTDNKIRNLFEGNNVYTEYVLEENFYRLLKYSKENYGKISHFE